MKRKFIIFLLCFGLLGFIAFPASVSAENTDVVRKPAMKSSGDVRTFWTEEKMKNAKPMPLPKLEGGPATMGGSTPWVYTSYQLTPDLQALYTQKPYLYVGKLFFTIQDVPYVCSASIVDAPTKDLVWTAGHCVYTPGIGWNDDFYFVPARFHGSNPYQGWTYKNAWTLTAWTTGLLEYDIGALVMNTGGPGGGFHVGTAGGLTFIANLARDQHFHAKGYPAEYPFDGEHHHTCAASWVTNDQPTGTPGTDPQTIGIGCDMTGGSSGGPWIVDLFTNNYVNSNVSYGYVGVPDEYYGPYYGDAAQALYDAASTDY